MKKIYYSILVGLSTFLASCVERDRTPNFTAYKPVIMARESLERSIAFHTPENIMSPGKIYYKDNFIFISERYKGVHLINNTDPKNPVNKGYITVPGCLDMAIKNNTLYVDNAVDLVAIDISNISASQILVKKRIKETFPEVVPPDGLEIPSKYLLANRPKNTVIIRWIK